MLDNDVRPTIFYFNPNIYPQSEYNIRKEESKRHAESLGLQWIDGDYDHAAWRAHIKGMEEEPERSKRCLECFYCRLLATAQKNAAHTCGALFALHSAVSEGLPKRFSTVSYSHITR